MEFQDVLTKPADELATDFTEALASLTPSAIPQWGAMDAQQMVEHLVLSIKYAMKGANPDAAVQPEKAIIHSKQELPRLIKGLAGQPHFYESLSRAKQEFTQVVKLLYGLPAHKVMSSHPKFGAMAVADWQAMQRKHIYHHFKQFALV